MKQVLILILTLFCSCTTNGALISLNITDYYANVSTLSGNTGDYLTTVGIVYNDTIIDNLGATFSTQGSYRSRINIDSDGKVTLAETCQYVTTYRIPVAAFISYSSDSEVEVDSDNATLPGIAFLNANIILNCVGIVTAPRTVEFSFSPSEHDSVGSVVYNVSSIPVTSLTDIKDIRFTFSSGYSSSFTVLRDGAVQLKRVLTPGTYYLSRVYCNYVAVLSNSSVINGQITFSLRVTVLGCSAVEEGNMEWVRLYPCSQTNIPCSQFHPLFSGSTIKRHCDSLGDYSLPDMSRCTLLQSKGWSLNPFAILWITFSTRYPPTDSPSLTSIQNEVFNLFPSGTALSIKQFGGYQSNVYYGFVMTYLVNLNNTIQPSNIVEVQNTLSITRRINYRYLRYEAPTKGLRAFLPTTSCEKSKYQYAPDNMTTFTKIKFCPTSSCSNCSFPPTSGEYKPPDSRCPKPTICNCSDPNINCALCGDCPTCIVEPSPPGAIDFECKDVGNTCLVNLYRGNLTVNKVIYKAKLRLHNNEDIKSYKAFFGLNGGYADYFSITRLGGEISVVSNLPYSSYYLYVSAFLDITFKNGTKFHNYTQASFRIILHDGVYFTESRYYVNWDPINIKNAFVYNMSDAITIRRDLFKKIDVTFSRISRTEFQISQKGIISTAKMNLRTAYSYYSVVYVQLKGTTTTGQAVDTTVSVSVTIVALGCRQEEGGGHVWDSIPTCSIATARCSDFDDSFDDYGMVIRRCTRNSEWMPPDFSRCRLKKNSPPFILLWYTYISSYTSHWTSENVQDTIQELRGLLVGYPIRAITPHHGKRSKVIYGFTQSFKISLMEAGPFTDAQLSGLWGTINTTRSLDRRSISSYNQSFGVLGFKKTNFCPTISPQNDWTYTSVCTLSDGVSCECTDRAPDRPLACCTANGTVDHKNPLCNITILPSVAPDNCTKIPDTIKLTHIIRSRYITLSWEYTGASNPDKLSLSYSSNVHSGTYSLSSDDTSFNLTGLMPSTVYTISVQAGCTSSGQAQVESDVIVTSGEDVNLSAFQLRFNQVSNCKTLRDNLQNGESSLNALLIASLSNGCLCTMDPNRISQLSMTCLPSQSKTTAIISGWIYDDPKNPASKYLSLLKNIANSKTNFRVAGMTITADPSCPVERTTPYSQLCSKASEDSSKAAGSSAKNNPSSDNGASFSVAGAAIGMVIGIMAWILFIIILAILLMKLVKERRRSNPPSPRSTVATVSLSTVDREEDEKQLKDDF